MPEFSPRYEAFHRRMRKAKGRAALLQCVSPGCSRQAAAWAWDHTGPSVTDFRCGRSVEYSLDMERYDALCRQHHNERDAQPRATECKYGHEITPERWRSYGCLECKRLRGRSRRAA